MRKIMLFLLIGLMCSGICYAASVANLQTVVNANETGLYVQADLTSSTVLVPGTHRILGFTITKMNMNSDTLTSIHDATNSTDSLSESTMIAEAEQGTTSEATSVWFPRPLEITNGIIVSQGGYSVLTIYYEYGY